MNNPVEGLPHDVHGLIPYLPSWWIVPLGIVSALVAAAIIVAIVKWAGRKKREIPVVFDSWEDLSARVIALSPCEPFTAKAAEDFFFQLSILLREGIEKRTRINATDMTLQELRIPLPNKLPLPQGVILDVINLLQRADEVKFAGAQASSEEAIKAQRDVISWIAALKPRDVTDLAALRASDIAPSGRGGSHAAR